MFINRGKRFGKQKVDGGNGIAEKRKVSVVSATRSRTRVNRLGNEHAIRCTIALCLQERDRCFIGVHELN